MVARAVAIDVGATALRLAELELKSGNGDPREGATLTTYAERPIPAGVIKDGKVEEPTAFASVVKDLLSGAKVKAKDAFLTIGHPSVMLREVTVPAQPMAQVRKSLAFHVQDLLPMATDDALLDFFPNAEIAGPTGPELRGLLVAAPKDYVRDLLAAFHGTGVGVAHIDHTAFSLWRSVCRGELMTSNVAIVDVGADTTTVVVSQLGAPRLARVLPQGGADANKAIASAYKGSSVDTEPLKRQIGMNLNVSPEHRPVAEAVSHVMAPLIDSIRNTLVYYASSNPGAAADRLVLTGGGASLPGFGQAVSSATRLPVMIGDPLSGIGLGKRVDENSVRGRETELATVVGLAMGGAA